MPQGASDDWGKKHTLKILVGFKLQPQQSGESIKHEENNRGEWTRVELELQARLILSESIFQNESIGKLNNTYSGGSNTYWHVLHKKGLLPWITVRDDTEECNSS